MLTPEESSALLRLQGIWQDAYHITASYGRWTARPLADPTDTLTAPTDWELKRLMHDHYAAHITRPPGPPATD